MLTPWESDELAEERARQRVWFTNAKGNLVRRYGRYLLTVFRKGPYYAWCVARVGKAKAPPVFSTERRVEKETSGLYPSVEDAIKAVMREVNSYGKS